MKKQEMSTAFDSGLEFLSPEEFDETVMGEVELFTSREFDQICLELQAWDLKSLQEMHSAMTTFLTTRNGKDLRLATNLVLDHCMAQGRTDDFKIYLLTNTLEWVMSCKDFEAMKAMAELGHQEEHDEEQE